MNKRSVLKQGRTKLIAMKTKGLLAALSALVILSCPAYAARSVEVGPSSTVVVPKTMPATNHVEGEVVMWSPPQLTVQGDIYYGSGSGAPAVVVKGGTQTFLITKNTKFPGGKRKHLKVGLSVKVLFYGRGSDTKEAESVIFAGKKSSDNAGDAEEDIPQKGIMIFDNFNGDTVHNKPQQGTVFTVNKPTVITSIRNYHWNNGHGAAPGSIWIVDQKGRKYGPWESSGEPGVRGVQNAYWVVSPNVKIRAGTYTIHDSDPATWSQNPRSQGTGMSQVEGSSKTPASPEHTPPVTTPPVSTAPKPPVTTPPVSTPQKPPVTTPPVSKPPKPPVTTPSVSTPQKPPQQGGGWHMEGTPKIEKNAKDLVNTGAYFNRSMNLADGSASGSMSWHDVTYGKGGVPIEKCKGTYTGSVSWTKPPAYMKPGSSLTFKATSKTSANNTCGGRFIGSGIYLKGGGLYISVDDASPKPPATFTVPKGSPGSKLVIEAFAKTANIGGKVTYNYIYK